MTKYVALLRGINVGGNRIIKMDQLKAIFADLGFHNISTFIQSGNVLFETDEKDTEKIARKIEKGIEKDTGFWVDICVRTGDELKKVIENMPFKDISDDWKLYVTFLVSEPSKEIKETIESGSNEYMKSVVLGRELYALISKKAPIKIVYAASVVEKKLKVIGTARNWNTTNKLFALLTK